MKKLIFRKYSNDRAEKYNLSTSIYELDNGEKIIEKAAMSQEAAKHLGNIENNYQMMEKLIAGANDNLSHKYSINACKRENDVLVFEYEEGENLERKISGIYQSGDKETALSMISELFGDYDVLSDTSFEVTDRFLEIFRIDRKAAEAIQDKSMPVANVDFILDNIIEKDDERIIIDYEWVYPITVPTMFLKYRALKSAIGAENCTKDILERFSINTEYVDVFDMMEDGFQGTVNGENATLGMLHGEFGKDSLKVSEILSEYTESKHDYDFEIFFDFGEGYTEQGKYVTNIQPVDGRINISLEAPDNARAVRIDPGNKCCVIELLSSSHKLVYDCVGLGDSVYLFNTDDPHFFIDELEDKKIDITLRLFAVDSALSEKLMADRKYIDAVLSANNGTIEQQRNTNQELEKANQELENKKQELEKANQEFENEKQELEKAKQDLENELTERSNQLFAANSEIARISGDYTILSNQFRETQIYFNQVLNSLSWRITSPLRSVRSFFENQRDSEFCTAIVNGTRYVKAHGVKEAWKRTLYLQDQKKKGYPDFQVHPYIDLGENKSRRISELEELEVLNKTLAVQLHLYYVDLLEEFCGYLQNIPYPFDLYISCQETADIRMIEKKASKIKNAKKVVVRGVPNRGRDIAPVFVWFADELKNYDYFYHMHSKKSLYTGSERTGWRQHSLDNIMGSETFIKKLFGLMEKEENLGLAYPDNHPDVPFLAYCWLVNEGVGRELLGRLGIPFEGGIFTYPAGSFYLAKKEAVSKLFEAHFTIEDFQEEAGQTDGTLAHAIERVIAFCAKNKGMAGAIVDRDEDAIRLGSSNKAFRPYFGQNKDDVKRKLSEYDVVSFDIFDTLITRCVLRPDDIFRLMERKISIRYGIQCNFLELRKKAESLAWNKKGVYTNINDIYAELPALMKVSQHTADEIKEMEISTELDNIIPRRDVLEVFNYLKSLKNIKIILVSDMYLTGDIIARLLEKCGYTGYAELIVSCECGKRKDGDTMWDMVLPEYKGKKFIHVGDNPRSDWQTLIDRKYESMWIINPFDAFKMDESYSRFHDIIERPEGMRLEDSIILGISINGGIFNSPWVQSPFMGIPEINDAWSLGYSIFGTIMSNYIMKIDDACGKDGILLFLAREGYILQKMYKVFHESAQREELPNYYFEASRRCVTVAAARTDEDVKEIIGQYYRGKMSGMLKSRLGMDMPKGVSDRELLLDLDVPENTQEVMDILKPVKKDMYAQFEREREAYIEYIENIAPREEWDRFKVLDVGYSGTIQYFLAKLLETKVGGYYLATFRTKPESIGCKCDAVYNKNNPHITAIDQSTLFLESVLQAPYGQLINFTKEDGQLKDNHKPVEKYDERIKEVQEGMIAYCRQLGTMLRDLGNNFGDVDETIVRVYETFLHGKYISTNVANIFSVEDDYCSNKTLKFNRENDKWM